MSLEAQVKMISKDKTSAPLSSTKTFEFNANLDYTQIETEIMKIENGEYHLYIFGKNGNAKQVKLTVLGEPLPDHRTTISLQVPGYVIFTQIQKHSCFYEDLKFTLKTNQQGFINLGKLTDDIVTISAKHNWPVLR